MSRRIDDDSDPVIARASAALRSHGHASESARAALRHVLAQTGQAGLERSVFARRLRIGVGIAAGLALTVGVGSAISKRDRRTASTATRTKSNTTMVEFSFDAPAARLVSVVGEFNGWNNRAAPMRHTRDGHWTTNLALAPGRHTYGFSIDGDKLVPDPRAPAAPEELFGIRHSVLVVTRGEY